MKPFFEELDYQKTSLGELSLRRRSVAELGGIEVYEVILGDSFLMSSLFHAVEDAVADLGLAELSADPLDVIVGGLGLGYTAVAALRDPRVRSLTIVEFLEPVIKWHQQGLVPLGATLSQDTRVKFRNADFFAMITQPPQPEKRVHAILLDIDHSPRELLAAGNADFYSSAGLNALAQHLHPGGVFSMWSDDPPDEEFLAVLRSVFPDVRAEIVKFPNPLLERDSASTVYLARLSP